MSQSRTQPPFAGAAASMTGATTRIAFLCAATLLCACSEPFVVLPGEHLAGEVSDPPADWSPFNAIQVVQLETRPDDPYSINIWMAAIGPDVYVATGADGTNWTEHLEQNADVRLRVEGAVYELEAASVLDPEERARVADAYVSKYDLDEDDNWVMKGQIFRLDRR